MLYSYSGILLYLSKEESSGTLYDMAEPQGQYINGDKPVTGGQILSDCT